VQSLQSESWFAPANAEYLPGEHEAHAVESAALSVVETFPAAQSVHIEEVEAPDAMEYLPEAQP